MTEMVAVTQSVYRGPGTTSSSHSRVISNASKTQETVLHVLTDDGVGGFGGEGTINYAGKSLTAKLVSLDSRTENYKSDHEDADAFSTYLAGSSNDNSNKGGEYGDTAVGEQILAASTITVTYAVTPSSPITANQSFRPPTVSIDLCPLSTDYIVPNSVRFTWMGHVYEDYDGVIIRDRTALDVGTVSGQLDYSSGIARLFDYVVNGPASAFSVQSLWTVRQNWTTASVFFRTPAAPMKPGGFVMNLADSTGEAITANGDLDGNLTGPHLTGRIDYLTGIGELQFGDFVLDSALSPAQKAEWWYDAADIGAVQPLKIWRPWPVDPTTLRFLSVSYTYLPLDAEILGLDPVSLPPDGRVPIFRRGGFAVVGHTGRVGPAVVTNGQTLNCGRERLSRVRLVGNNGVVISTGYNVDLEAGTVSIVDVTGYSQPVTLEHRIEDMAIVDDVQIDGTLGLIRELTHNYPVPGSYVSSVLYAGNLKARVSVLFDQLAWGNVWDDTVIGSNAPATYNDAANPILVTNEGAMTERWAIRFTGTTTYDVIGEHVGVIATGTTGADCAPINAAAGQPYFTLRAAGLGGGWSANNVIRFNTVGALFPVSVIMTVLPGRETVERDSFSLLVRGGVDRE